MIGRCVGGHWPPLRLGNVQMVDKRCAEVAPQGTFSCPDGQFTLPHPMVKSNIGYNSRMLRNKRKKIPQRKPLRDLLCYFSKRFARSYASGAYRSCRRFR